MKDYHVESGFYRDHKLLEIGEGDLGGAAAGDIAAYRVLKSTKMESLKVEN